MSQDEMILTLLRAVARSMVCEKCGGTGTVMEYPEGYRPGQVIMLSPGQPVPESYPVFCSCRTAIRDLLKPQGM